MGFNFLNCGDHFCLRPSVALVIDFGSESHIEGKLPPFEAWWYTTPLASQLIKQQVGGWIFFFFFFFERMGRRI